MASLDESRILGQVLVAPLGPDSLAIWYSIRTPSAFSTSHCEHVPRKSVTSVRASRAALVGTISIWYEPLAKEIGRVRVPTLVIAGEHDPVLTPAYVKEQILDRTPGARMVTLPCGHEIPIEMPSDMAWLLEAFLAASQNA
jgi:pimeloyl-ACP methyl ester carboxylesterase